MKDVESIIIGSGMGGLTTALSLLRAGHSVAIFEQHYVPGGWAHSFLREGYKFSPGVHFVGHLQEGGQGRKVYEGLGVANDMVFFRQNPLGYDYNIVGDHHFRMPAGVDALQESLSQQYPKERKRIKRYLKFSQQVYKELYLALEVNTLKDYLFLPWNTRHIGRMGWWKLSTILNFYLKDPYVKAHLSMQCGNYGMPPKLAPFAVHAIVSNHCMAGTYYPRGSGAGIVKAFTKNIKQLGGMIRTRAGVKKILLEEKAKGKRAVGIELENGETFFANNIISNADPHRTYLNMVGREHLSNRLLKKLSKTRYSAAALNLFLVVDMDLRKMGMDSGNLWYSSQPDLNQVYELIIKKDQLGDKFFPGLFITSPTLKDPVSYDGKYHTLEVIAFVNYETFQRFEHLKYEERNEDYEHFKRQLERKMLRTINKILPGIEQAVKIMELGTPITANHYINSTNGNCYGPEKSFGQIAPFNYKFKSEIENLFLCGAATLSHGLIGTVNSGLGAATKILKCPSAELLQFNEGQDLRIFEAEDDTEWPDWLKAKREVKQNRGRLKIIDTNK